MKGMRGPTLHIRLLAPNAASGSAAEPILVEDEQHYFSETALCEHSSSSHVCFLKD
jgi:hypothetical protein